MRAHCYNVKLVRWSKFGGFEGLDMVRISERCRSIGAVEDEDVERGFYPLSEDVYFMYRSNGLRKQDFKEKLVAFRTLKWDWWLLS
jgi:hypothetical protein